MLKPVHHLQRPSAKACWFSSQKRNRDRSQLPTPCALQCTTYLHASSAHLSTENHDDLLSSPVPEFIIGLTALSC
jgi:hypothetical protein